MSRWLAARALADRLVACLLLVATSPVIAAVAAAKRIEDGGPAFVRIPRVGRHGHPFAIVKIRSMRADGPSGLANGDAVSAGDDPRTTRLGRILRRWRIDELPQLAQVAAGSMALIGPRPEAAAYVDVADPSWATVLRARPGIAGITQLLVEGLEESLRSEDFARYYAEHLVPLKLALDRWYVEHARPSTDAMVAAALVQRFALRQPPTLLLAHLHRRQPALAHSLAVVADTLASLQAAQHGR